MLFENYITNYFAIPILFITFVPLKPAKPLYNAQIGWLFFYYTYMKTSFIKPCFSPEQVVQILKSRGMLMNDEHRVENYRSNGHFFIKNKENENKSNLPMSVKMINHV